jgi:hypothetical protein
MRENFLTIFTNYRYYNNLYYCKLRSYKKWFIIGNQVFKKPKVLMILLAYCYQPTKKSKLNYGIKN